jgi:hypothetical protein
MARVDQTTIPENQATVRSDQATSRAAQTTIREDRRNPRADLMTAMGTVGYAIVSLGRLGVS